MLWDSKTHAPPKKIMTGHDKGVLSLSWCKQDADLLLFMCKDNRSILWNPQSCEIVVSSRRAPTGLSGFNGLLATPPCSPPPASTARSPVHSLQSTTLPRPRRSGNATVCRRLRLLQPEHRYRQRLQGSVAQAASQVASPSRLGCLRLRGQLVSSGGPSPSPSLPPCICATSSQSHPSSTGPPSCSRPSMVKPRRVLCRA